MDDAMRCRGMRDMLPQDMACIRLIEQAFRSVCAGWGYEEVRTPTIEHLHLFTSAGTLSPQMLDRVYSFLDWDGWSGQRVVLRPDGTIPTARLYISQLQRPPARLCYVQNVFSFQASQRERWQCGVEFIGGTPPGADAELIRLSLDVLRGLGIEPELRLGHLGLVKALLRETGQDEEALHQILRREFEPLIKARPELERPLSLLFELKGNSAGFLRNIQSLLLPQLPGIAPALTDFLSLTELLTSLDCSYEIDMALADGFEYYTGVVFQFFAAGERLGGGGRYDNLIPLLDGKALPASGFALSMEPLMKLVPELPRGDKILVEAPSLEAAFALAETLRRQGYRAEVAQSSASAAAFTVSKEGSRYQLSNQSGDQRRLSSLKELYRVLESWGAVKVSSA